VAREDDKLRDFVVRASKLDDLAPTGDGWELVADLAEVVRELCERVMALEGRLDEPIDPRLVNALDEDASAQRRESASR
jgi:hypothetical protein